MSCPSNLAINRQTRMLSNLSLAGCYDTTLLPPEKRELIILNSAKDKFYLMAFFGLTEFQYTTQYLFERTFRLKFVKDFVQFNHTHASQVEISPKENQKRYELNKLDIELYNYARELFFKQLKFAIEKDLQSGKAANIPPGLQEFVKVADNSAKLDVNLLRQKLIERPVNMETEGDDHEYDDYYDDEKEGEDINEQVSIKSSKGSLHR